jgi:hypothetical protein
VVVFVPSLRRSPGCLELWRRLEGTRRTAIVVQDPDDAARLADAERLIVAPTPSPAAVARAVAVMLGQARAEGRAPIDLSGVTEELRAASFSALEHRTQPS